MKKLIALTLPLMILAGCQSTTPSQPSIPVQPYSPNQTLYCTAQMAHYEGARDARRGHPFDQNYGSNCVNQRNIEKLRTAYKSGFDSRAK